MLNNHGDSINTMVKNDHKIESSQIMACSAMLLSNQTSGPNCEHKLRITYVSTIFPLKPTQVDATSKKAQSRPRLMGGVKVAEPMLQF